MGRPDARNFYAEATAGTGTDLTLPHPNASHERDSGFQVRQELAHTLYQQDAACRVIARLSKERDDARRQLAAGGMVPSSPASTAAGAGAGDAMEVEEAGLPAEVKDNIIALSKKLTQARKQRTIPKETAEAATVKTYQVVSSHPTHSASLPGILCLDIDPKNEDRILTGGVDKKIVLFSRKSGAITASMGGHTKKVSDVLFHPTEDILLSASYDKTIRIWKPPKGRAKKYSTSKTLRQHAAEVTGICLHPMGSLIGASSGDKTWSISDIASGACLSQLSGQDGTPPVPPSSFPNQPRLCPCSPHMFPIPS